jgi:poly(A) polymerase
MPAPDKSRARPTPLPRVIPSDLPHSALDQNALRVISRLQREQHEAYLVGGCVRDLLLGRRPKDYDVATSATPRRVKSLFSNGRIIGRRFKLVHVTYGGQIVETATFRRAPQKSDEDDEDLLIVDDNEFGTAEEDARRRDFTINALFLNPYRHEILDYVDGLEDLEAGVLRTIGDPRVRMAEDPVRILRAVKFATRLGFRIEEGTWAAMIELAPELARSAKPRVLEELLRLLRSGTALGALRMMRACGALKVLLPEVDAFLGDRESADAIVHERAESFWRLLEALDSDVHQGNLPSTAACVAVLFLRGIERDANVDSRTHASLGDPDPEQPSEKRLSAVAERRLEEFAVDYRLSRRDANKAARAISLQRRFTQPATKRFSPILFAKSEDFVESLELFRLRSLAWGQGWDVYEAWLERAREAGTATPEQLEQEKKRKRRRGRRRRRGSERSDDTGAPEGLSGDE